MTNATRIKYRPVLTAAQITHALALAKSESPLSDLSISLIATLSPFAAKIENAGITPAYTLTPRSPRHSLESLGEEPARGEENEYIKSMYASGTTSKEEFWEYCYNKYEIDPAACSLEEIRGAQEHKYLEGLMTPEELADFEKHGI